MYHRFSSGPEPFKIQQSVFENQIKFLVKNKYTLISLQHYAEVLNGRRDDLPDNSVIITIDDGYWDNYTYAYPILNKYTVPATIFLVTDFINRKSWLWSNKLEFILKRSKLKSFEFPLGNKTSRFLVDNFQNWHRTQLKIFHYCSWITENQKNGLLNELAHYLKVNVPKETVCDFQPLTWEQIKEMNANGIDFGSHTCSHPILSKLDLAALRHEIVGSKLVIEKEIGRSVTSFCYPNGQPDDIGKEVVNAVRNSGYTCAVTTIKGSNRIGHNSKYLLKRMSFCSDNEIKLISRMTLSE